MYARSSTSEFSLSLSNCSSFACLTFTHLPPAPSAFSAVPFLITAENAENARDSTAMAVSLRRRYIRVQKPYHISNSILAGLLGASLMSADLEKNDARINWLDTTDEWGRPWGDAASDFYDRLDAQRKHLAEQNVSEDRISFAVGTESTLQKVFRPKIWFKGDFSGSIELEAARGEFEGFQLVVCPIAEQERSLRKLSIEREQGQGPLHPQTVAIQTVEVAPFEHVGRDYRIGVGQIRLYKVGYIRTVPAQYPVLHTGEWPDPLLPLAPFEVSNPYCQPIWVELHVPRDAPAGDYTSRIVVKGLHDVRIDIRLKVWDFTLPDPPTYSMGWSLHDWFNQDGMDKLLERLDMLLDHRLAPWHAAFSHQNIDEHDRVMTHLLERGVRIQATSGEPSAEFVQHLRQRGWLDHYVCLWGDEPHERDYPTYQARTQKIHQAFPDLAVAMTDEPTPHDVGLFDLWIAEPSAQNNQWIADAMGRGDRIWWYLCQLPIHAEYNGPIHACPGMVVDRPAIDHRITYWLAFKHGIEGVSYWAISAWPPGFEKWPNEPWPPNPPSKFPYSGWHNANGFLCYPGVSGAGPGADGDIWPSIRLKCLRDGLEDYDYLRLLRERAGPSPSEQVRSLLQIPHELAMGLRYYNKDPRILLQVRRAVAEQIIAHQ